MHPTYKHELSKKSLDILSQEDIERIQKRIEKPNIKVKSKGKNNTNCELKRSKFYV